LFAIGSTFFAIATAPGMSATAGAGLPNLLCFIGSWFFTTAGWMQVVLARLALGVGWYSAAMRARSSARCAFWWLRFWCCRALRRIAASSVGAKYGRLHISVHKAHGRRALDQVRWTRDSWPGSRSRQSPSELLRRIDLSSWPLQSTRRTSLMSSSSGAVEKSRVGQNSARRGVT
jgi:hypothetical protein